jgi:hypothetical protein
MLFGAITCTAQQSATAPEKKFTYSNAIGIRAGGTSGLTYKHLMNSNNGLEFILGFWPQSIGVTGLFEKHVESGLGGLRFYYGGGAHFTVETNRPVYRKFNDNGQEYVYRYGKNGFGIGIDGIVGLEYKIPVIPVALSVDLKPFIETTNYGGIYTAIDPSLGIKFAF